MTGAFANQQRLHERNRFAPIFCRFHVRFHVRYSSNIKTLYIIDLSDLQDFL